jgi:hypothetical protein
LGVVYLRFNRWVEPTFEVRLIAWRIAKEDATTWYAAQWITLSLLHPTYSFEAARSIKTIPSFRCDHAGTYAILLCKFHSILNQPATEALALVRRIHYEEIK